MTGVSFVITVYNKAPYLADLVASLNAQRGDFEREVIFVDDGSRDNSLAVLRDLVSSAPNTTILARENGGQARATNAGLAAATLPYIKLIDADDLLHVDATARLIAALDAHPTAPMAFGDKIDFTDGDPLPDLAAPLTGALDEPMPDPLAALFRISFANPTQILLRRDAVRRSGGAEERVAHSMEYGLMLKLAPLGPFIRVNETLAFLRVGITGNLSQNKRLTLQESMRHPLTFLRDHPDTPMHLQRQAAIRIAKRAWLWRNRERGDSVLSAPSFRRAAAYWPFSDPLAIIEECAKSMDE